MKISEKKTRFNIIDLFVVLILLAIMAAGIWFFAGRSADGDDYVYYVVELRQTLPGHAHEITVGGEIRDSVRNYFLGHVAYVHYYPARMVTFDQVSLTHSYVYVPERYDIFITIRGRGQITPSEIRVEGQPVRIGMEKWLRMYGFAGGGFVVGIDTGE